MWSLIKNSVDYYAILLSSGIFENPHALLLSGGVSVAVVSSVLTAIVTSIIVCLFLKKKSKTPGPLKTTPTHATPSPIYDTLTETNGKDNIELRGNVAYAPVNL